MKIERQRFRAICVGSARAPGAPDPWLGAPPPGTVRSMVAGEGRGEGALPCSLCSFVAEWSGRPKYFFAFSSRWIVSWFSAGNSGVLPCMAKAELEWSLCRKRVGLEEDGVLLEAGTGRLGRRSRVGIRLLGYCISEVLGNANYHYLTFMGLS